MDLYKAYKVLKSRAKSHPEDFLCQEIFETARSIFYADGKKRTILRTVSKLRSLEKKLPFKYKRYGTEMYCAVSMGEYSIDRPYAIRHRFDQSHKTGLIYVMTSPTRSGQSKLGATTLSIKKRMSCYQTKYQYPVHAENWKQVEKPFEIEDLVSKVVREHRVSGQTSGDSIEWYHLSPEELWTTVLKTLSQSTHSSTH